MISLAYEQLLNKPCEYSTELKYTRRFSPYNANIRLRGQHLEVRLSKEWQEHSEDLQLGIVQHLLAKMFKSKAQTWQMEVYEKFMQKVGDNTQITQQEESLKEYFDENNEKYFSGMLDEVNLKWGQHSLALLGRYEYGSNTITISTALKERPDLLAYVMYHEMLHKKFKFEHKGGRNVHHSKQFRQAEKKFDLIDAEKQLENFIRLKKRKNKFSLWDYLR